MFLHLIQPEAVLQVTIVLEELIHQNSLLLNRGTGQLLGLLDKRLVLLVITILLKLSLNVFLVLLAIIVQIKP